MSDDGWESAPAKPAAKSDDGWESAPAQGKRPYVKAAPNEEDKQHIKDMITNMKPGLESAKFDRGEKTFAEKYPYTASYYAGIAEPFAGIAQYAGIHKPVEYLKEITQEAESTGRPGVGLTKFGGEMAGLSGVGKLIPELMPSRLTELATKGMEAVPKVAEYAGKAKEAIAASPFLQGMVGGAGASAVMPTQVDEGKSFLKEKLKDIGEGSIFGGIGGKGTQMVFDPRVGEKIKMLKEMGQKYFTPGQLATEAPILGPILHKAESALTSVPIAGSFIQGSIANTVKDFNKNIAQKVVEPIGETVPKDVKAGHQLMTWLQDKVGSAYDDIADKISFGGAHKVTVLDDAGNATKTSTLKALQDKLHQVRGDLSTKDEELLTKDFNKFIIDPLSDKLVLTGEQFRRAEKRLGDVAFDAYKAGNSTLSNAYRELQAELRDMLAQQNPAHAKELQNIHEMFKRFTRIERAANTIGSAANEGVFTPRALLNAAKAKATQKGQFAAGKAMFQPEATAAEEILGKQLPSSGTAERLMTPWTLAEGAGELALHGIPALTSAAIYNPLTLTALTKLATERPEIMRKVAPGLQRFASKALPVYEQDKEQKPVGGLNLTAP